MQNNRKNYAQYLLVLFILLVNTKSYVYAQKGDITIRLQFASVDEYYPFSSCENISKGDTVPYRFSAPFLIENNTKKEMLFGSNTRNYYLELEDMHYKDSNYGVIGRFLMIHGTDTIPLYTDKYNIHTTERDDLMLWGQVVRFLRNSRSSIFEDLLCRIGSFKTNHKEQIYNFINEARFVYVPVLSDYERRMSECKNDSVRNTIIYPKEPIEVIKDEPFNVFFIWNEDQENAVLYREGKIVNGK